MPHCNKSFRHCSLLICTYMEKVEEEHLWSDTKAELYISNAI